MTAIDKGERSQSVGVPASPSGLRPFGVEPAAQSQAEPLVPNAWPLQGYAPGNYCGLCHDCGEEKYDLDKRAWRCLECAARDAKRFMHERCKDIDNLQRLIAEFADKVERQAECLEGYAQQAGFEAKPVPSVFHFQASHFRDYARELRLASGMSASGQDAKRLEAKPASPTAEGGDAQGHPHE